MVKMRKAGGISSEPDQIVIDGDIPVTLRRMTRARRISLRVARAGGAVVLTLPPDVSLRAGRDFAQSKASWLRRVRAGVPALRRVADGAMLPVAGQALRVTVGAANRLHVAGGALMVPTSQAPGAAVAAWLRHLARQRLVEACDRYAGLLGRRYRMIALRDTRSRWGSCSHDGRLMFSWRLAMAPPAVLDYVAAHEVAHLLHMDHSDRFWAATGFLMPDYAIHRQWLRDHGSGLHLWVFKD